MQEERMHEREHMILSFVEDEHYRPMKIKEMAALMNVPKKQRGEFHEVLDRLIAKGKIAINRRGLVGLPEENIVVGEFMATQKGFGFVRVEGHKEDIFIPEPYCNHAFHGDLVKVLLKKSAGMSGRRPEGEVIQIVKRAIHTVVGTFQRKGKITFVLPDNLKWNQDIYIPKGATLEAENGHKVVVEITDYGDDKKSPEGYVTQILGRPSDPGVDIMSIVKGFGLPDSFSDEVMAQVAKIPLVVELSEIGGRVDLRNQDTVTIDGEDAKDLDDAITLNKTAEGEYELGVHIADVSHYVTEHSPLDKEALNRGTSVYLVDRVIPMLPFALSNGICSLNAGVDRLALSCMMTIDKKGQVKSHRIAETVIRVNERMSYTDVNDIVTNHKKETCERYEKLVSMFEAMKELALILRKKRIKKGSIDFDFPESKIMLDEEGHPMEIHSYDRNVATKIIEDFMLLANETVAEEYYWREIPFVYRVHETPDEDKIKKLAILINNFGYSLHISDEVRPGQIQKLLAKIQGTPQETMISRLALRSMKQARYTPENDGHFGLAARYYTHFTSPIRRYPDLQIHRIIKDDLRGRMNEKKMEHYQTILPEVTRQASETERRAEEAERETIRLKKAEYMEAHIGEVFEGVISGITNWGIYVELSNTIEGLVHVANMYDDHYDYYEDRYEMVGEHTGKTYKLGETVYVRVIDADCLTRTIDFEMADEGDMEDGEE